MKEPNPQGDFKCPSCGVSLVVLISTEAYREESKPTATIKRTLEDVKTMLPQDILEDLNVAFSKNKETIHIVPKKFLGKENFYKVQKAVKNMHGEWVSQGKKSYWWVPTKETVEV
jgi:uncharacterized Zn finger protein (UPF0148 family)